ncbi:MULTISPECIES: sensor histidine kinase [Catenuloplanes]|uniref:histidine kinase n=1 Tax=Catenuloplanes niger TaxID=587534 RepID=A0AAE3ZTQ9_9ACTN|nr:histidine kinase [Catenuloplanes niger]MDR7324827.1 signal transduction histidine kinase [Catenuloplanes niger]
MWERAKTLARRNPTAVDAAVAIACFLLTVSGHGAVEDPRPVVLLLAAISTLPLVWRQRAPFPVAVLCGAGTIGLIVAHGFIDWPYGQLVATYTVAAASPFAARAVLAGGTLTGVVFTQQVMDKPLGAVLTSGSVFVASFALGTGARARRDRISLLEERALRHAEERLRHAEERAAVAARERERIARDMHDILAHSISMIAVQAEAGPLLVHRDPDRAARAFDAISGTAHDALTQLRRTLGVLRGGPDDRAPQPGLESVPELAGRAREAGLTVTVTEHGTPAATPPEVAVAIYRVVQESLTNVIRHARATAVRVDLTWSAGSLRAEITDDGRGAAAAGDAPGHGLIGMRERVSACGGTFTAGPDPGGGFTVTATVPLTATEPRHSPGPVPGPPGTGPRDRAAREPADPAAREPAGTAAREPAGTAAREPAGTAAREPAGTAAREPAGTAGPTADPQRKRVVGSPADAARPAAGPPRDHTAAPPTDATDPPAAGPLAAGPLATGPLATGPLAAPEAPRGGVGGGGAAAGRGADRAEVARG